MGQEKQQTSSTEQSKATTASTQQEQEQTQAANVNVGEGEQGEEGTSIERSEEKGIERQGRGGLGRVERFSSPLGLMQRMMDEMDRVFSRFGGGIMPNVFDLSRENIWSPAIETFERDGRLVLRADLPGLERNDLKVEVEGDELVISGERKETKRQGGGRGRYYSERHYGAFERRMTLPVDVNPDDIEASFENGVLEISLAMPEEKPKTKKIEVKSGKPEQGPRSVH